MTEIVNADFIRARFMLQSVASHKRVFFFEPTAFVDHCEVL